MDDKLLIHLDILGKYYPLWVKRDEAHLARDAAKQISTKVLQYQQSFKHPDLDIKDMLIMVALQLSIENLKLEAKNDTTPFIEKIEQLTGELEKYLKDK